MDTQDDGERLNYRSALSYLIGIGIGAWLMYRYLMGRSQLVIATTVSADEMRGLNATPAAPRPPLPFRAPRVPRRKEPAPVELRNQAGDIIGPHDEVPIATPDAEPAPEDHVE